MQDHESFIYTKSKSQLKILDTYTDIGSIIKLYRYIVKIV
jgi:hypothetical protein